MGNNIRFKFHKDNYDVLCLGCDDSTIFRAESDSNKFLLVPGGHLIVGSNGISKLINQALLNSHSVELHPNFDGEVAYKEEYILDMKIPKNELEAISTYGFQYELL